MASVIVALIIASENCFIQLKAPIKYLFLVYLFIYLGLLLILYLTNSSPISL